MTKINSKKKTEKIYVFEEKCLKCHPENEMLSKNDLIPIFFGSDKGVNNVASS